ncbi:nuclear body protein SP140-like protein isoform X5 [Artibeus jamaicensis]|uniref:nuclear body protein SP140-like protein isoform X5 n=1 Tax=Artibeus jamaicensis TaxID=9417 RepID=UPI00235B29FC|nr:nuclear body protein SP140-like protein isoform X5 [Artibeus jamaicensis]
MATEGSHCNTRMSAQYEEKYNSLKKTAGELFKKYKVEISNAINKAFPLFEILRDRGFITNEKYKESRESLIKRISVQEAVYDILSELEKTFDLTLLGALFSKAIMENYPDLKDSYRIFKKEMPDIKDFLETDAENKGQSDAQPSLDQGSGKNSCLNLLWSSPFSMNNTEISNEDSVERRNREEAPEVSTSGVKRKPGTVNPENNSTPGIKKKKKKTGQQPDVPVNFEAEILPVTCKKKTGLLIKRKLERGATRKCIRTEDGNWFTPREFEVRAGYEKANNWRNSLTCGGKTLKLLIELKYIHPPPTTKKVENSDKCVICQDGGKLFGCATCHKVFHEGCHIPPVEIARSGWKCTFCLTRNPPSHQHYRESEVLVKLMEPEELLKCAFLLLIVYASLEGKVFPNIPHENYAKEASQCLEKLRKLDKIKESLLKENYHSVESFVRAMDEFFTIPSCSDAELTQDDFKKNFKEQFAIQETN